VTKKETTESPKQNPDTMLLKAIAKANDAVATASLEAEAAAENNKLAKAQLQAALHHLRQVIVGQDAAALERAAKAAHADEPWRDERMDTLGLGPKIVEALHNANLDTMGQLADYLADERHNQTDVAGVGESVAVKINAAMDKRLLELRASETEEKTEEAK
jgi:hypothetical protein